MQSTIVPILNIFEFVITKNRRNFQIDICLHYYFLHFVISSDMLYAKKENEHSCIVFSSSFSLPLLCVTSPDIVQDAIRHWNIKFCFSRLWIRLFLIGGETERVTVAHSPMKREFCLSVSKTLFESHRKDERIKKRGSLAH